jgi:hypothetical protein
MVRPDTGLKPGANETLQGTEPASITPSRQRFQKQAWAQALEHVKSYPNDERRAATSAQRQFPRVARTGFGSKAKE